MAVTQCPKCKGKTQVVDTRVRAGELARRRKCKECGETFYTIEKRVEEAKLMNDVSEEKDLNLIRFGLMNAQSSINTALGKVNKRLGRE